MKLGIIGGNGKMGKMFSRLFKDNGFDVLISDIGTKTTNEEIVKTCDAVMFSVPISVTASVIESLLPYAHKGQILMDLTSIKKPAIDAMMKSDCEVLGLHPMFGPTLNLKKQTIVACKEREREKTTIFLELFEHAGMNVKIANAVEHDKQMAIVQGMTHFNAIVFGHALSKLELDLNETLGFTSPIYKMRFAMIGRILAQDAGLYADIELENPVMESVLKELDKSNEKLIRLIKSKDKEGFINYFNDAAKAFAGHKKESMELTNRMIKAISDE
ncbi:MAG: prephenate dehydrogenase/arogenate dehydrogenase family protein [Candidatus Woesearchaeota archaeon]|nr:prephenate dehydrogenase/arogenate dehydrogenase family protein [Candidatus Woesearchaeota archaeon]